MTKKNPDDSVRKEQFGAIENAAETEEAILAKNTQTLESPANSADQEEIPEKSGKTKEDDLDEVSAGNAKNEKQQMIMHLMTQNFLRLIIQDI